MRGPKGLDIGLDVDESEAGLPDTLSNRAAIIYERLRGEDARLHMPIESRAHLTLEHVTAVLVADAELTAEVRMRADAFPTDEGADVRSEGVDPPTRRQIL